MFPSSNRVKLNRVTIKAVAARRRRSLKAAAIDVSPDSSKLCENSQSESGSKEHTPSGDRTEQGQETVPDAVLNTHLSPSAPTSSKECLRRAARGSQRSVRGDRRYVSPRRKNLVKRDLKLLSTDFAPSPTAFKVCGKRKAVQTTEKIVVWINKYPKVILCDVAAKLNACSHGCGYVLPQDLKSKKLLCFKRDMRAACWIWPSCSGHKKFGREKGAEVKNSIRSPSVQNGNSICQAESLTEQNKYTEEVPDAEALKSFCSGWTDAGVRTLASPLKGKPDEDDGVLNQDGGPGSDPIGLEIRGDGRIKLRDGVECSRTCSFYIKKRNVSSKYDLVAETDVQQTSPTLSKSDEEEPENFTCQRVRPYFQKLSGSCARTYMSWPFSDSWKKCKVDGSAGSLTETSAGSSAISFITENQSLACSSIGENLNISSDTVRMEQGSSSLGSWVQAKVKPVEDSGQSGRSAASLPSGHHEKKPGTEAGSRLASPFSCHEATPSTSTSTQSELHLNDWETFSARSSLPNSSSPIASSCASGPPSSFSSGKIQNREGKTLDAQVSVCSSPLRSPLSSIGLHDDCSRDDEFHHTRSPPILEPPMSNNIENGHEYPDCGELLLPPVLSPITSPYTRVLGRTLCQSRRDSKHQEKVVNKDPTPSDHCLVPVVNCNSGTCSEPHEHHGKESKGLAAHLSHPTDIWSTFSPRRSEVEHCGVKKTTIDESNSKANGENDQRCSELLPFYPQTKTTVMLDIGTEGQPSPGSDNKDPTSPNDYEEQSSATEEDLSSFNTEGSDGEAGPAKEPQEAILDEVAAFEQDILLIDVTQEDPELFGNLPEKSLLNLGPVRDTAAPKKKPIPRITFSPKVDQSSSAFDQRLTPVTIKVLDDNVDDTEETEIRPWRPRCRSIQSKNPNPYPVSVGQSRNVDQLDRNNNELDGNPTCSSGPSIQRVSFSNDITHPTASRTEPLKKTLPNGTDFWRQKSNDYCRNYFCEWQSCDLKMCRFLHLPREGDEKMCVDTVARFSNHLASLQRAGAVFAGYYQSSPPGEYFSRPVYLSLLWALLKAGMVSSIFSVLRVSLVYNLVPGHDFLLALFSYVRDKSLVGFIPELLQHTIKMVSLGLELNLDCIENVKSTAMFQQTAHQISHATSLGSQNLSACPPNPDFLNLVHGNVEIQLCAKQEDWRRMGEVYRSICQLSQHPIHVERITGQIAIALLAENKNKVALPFAAFVESVCKNEDKDDSVVRSFVGRIGVSLMLRYHKNHHWHKGCKVVQVLSSLKMDYVTLKSLFGNEDGASPCFLITVAAELFLMSGMAEAALNTFREHGWFLGSWARPSKPADLESRTNVQIHLARKISIRDTLEVLCNLPGVKEPIDSIDISRYAPHFTSHLQMCLETERHTFLPVASDTVEFMLSKGLAVDPLLLQTTIEKLGRQNHWLRAREVFKHSLSVGYYPEVSAEPGLMELTVPCSLGEVELVLSLEMFVALNASVILLSDTVTPTLSITLKRTHNSEVDYISAGTRLLLASSLPQPKLDVHYTNVNVSQEQVFRLDVASARRWLQRNHLWASELWTPRARCLDQN